MIEALDLCQVLSHVFCQWPLALQLFLVIVKPWLTLAPVVLVVTFAPIAWASKVFLGDFGFGFTFGAWRAFVPHAFHHLHQALTSD
jgi:hypothetical protein